MQNARRVHGLVAPALLVSVFSFGCSSASTARGVSPQDAPVAQSIPAAQVQWVDTPVGKAVRAGGAVNPEIVTRVDPFYPESDRRSEIGGIARLELVIGETGQVIHDTVLEAPTPALGEAAAIAARQWTFKPAEVDGVRVRVSFPLTINFRP